MVQVAEIRRVTAEEAVQLQDALADVLVDCVEGGASVSFMLPFSQDRARAFWSGVAQSVARNERVLLVAINADGDVVGTVQLVTDQPENQTHRADVSKMLVSSKARRQGLGARLLAAVEACAREEGRTVLVLDTSTGSDAERLYQKGGWQHAGTIPLFARMPDGPLSGTSYYFKILD